MRIGNKKKYFALLLVIVCTVSLSVAYAALSTKLVITGRTDVTASSWDIKFQNLSASVKGEATYTLPTLENTSLKNYSVTLANPTDSVDFLFDIYNGGTINAKILSLVKDTPVCKGLANSSTGTQDSQLVCKDLVYKITYQNGTPIATNDVLNSKQTAKLKLTIGYNPSAAQLPSNDVVVTNLNISIMYGQA